MKLHQVLVEQLLQRVWDKGDIYKAKYAGGDADHHSINNNVNINFGHRNNAKCIVCQAALAQACDQKNSCHAILYAVTVDMKASLSIGKAVPACRLLHTHTNILTGIDHASFYSQLTSHTSVHFHACSVQMHRFGSCYIYSRRC